MNLYEQSLRTFLQPIISYLDDISISEIMINGNMEVWIEKGGKLYKTPAKFTEQGLLAAVRNLAQFVNRPLNEERLRLDARLPDGSRVHVVMPPVSRKGIVVSIRKFSKALLLMDDLVKFGALSFEAAKFLEAVVKVKKNLLIAGGTGSGKTTILNILSNFIPDDERIITIEDSAELQINKEHVVPFESRPADDKGRGEITIRDLLHSSLRLRPDRIIIGEVRGGESFDLLQAMNTGHSGSMSTLHANSPVEALSRLESLCLMSGIELPLRAVRAQIAAAIDIIICCSRFSDGSRKITHISEMLPLNEKGDYRINDLFVFTQTAKEADGTVCGFFAPTGIIPTFQSYLLANGYNEFSDEFFYPQTYGYPPPLFFTGHKNSQVSENTQPGTINTDDF